MIILSSIGMEFVYSIEGLFFVFITALKSAAKKLRQRIFILKNVTESANNCRTV